MLIGNTNLAVLDVSANPILENLWLNNTPLTSLDLSTNTSLKSLRTWETNITELDLSNQANLAGFFGHNGAVEKLNLRNGNNTAIPNGGFSASGNPSLACIVVDDAGYSTTTWTNVDVTTSFSVTYCEYTAIPDANFEARLEALGYDDISGDGQVPTALIEVITTLTVNGKSVADFTGLEDFVSLTYLDVGNNSVTNLDVSNLTLLEFLRVDANSLTSLDLTTNTALVDLRCSYNSGITSLDMSNLTLLETAHLSHNNLTSVNVSNNALLYELNAVSNDITTIDLSANVALTELNLSSNPNLTVLDLANNTLLEQLYASNCGLTSVTSINTTVLSILNVSNNNLTSLDISNTVHRLFELSVAENNLTSLDLNGASSIFKLTAYTNNIESLDLSTTNHIEFINVANNNLSFLNIKNGANDFVLSLNSINNPSLACILVDDAAYSTTNWTNIDETTSFSDTYCRYTAIPDANFEAELEALGYDDISGDGQVPTVLIEGVTSLALPNKGINDLTGIEDFVALTSLNCRLNNLTALDVSQNVLLSTLTADGNNFTTIDVSNNTDLVNLNLAGSNLTSLDISNNTGLRKLFVQNNGTLSSLDISNNVQLVEFRTFNTNIAALDLSVHPNLELLESYNSPLAAIDVSNNPALEVFRVDNTSVTELDVSNNANIRTLRVNNTGVESLDLSNQTALQTLYVDDTSLNYLNVKNGNNTNITTFRAENNPNLTCILVDDPAYSIANWTDIDGGVTFNAVSCDTTAPVITLIGDASLTIEQGSVYIDEGAIAMDNIDGDLTTAIVVSNPVDTSIIGTYTVTYNVTDAAGNMATEVTRTVDVINSCPLVSLPDDNFTITTASETCIDQDNGTISINAITALNYSTTINGVDYNFGSSLEVSDLPPGTYPFCIRIEGATDCEQCYEVTIEDAESLAGKTELITEAGSAKVSVDLNTGTAPYIARINNEIVGEFTTNIFTVDVQHGDEVEIASSVACEGKLSTKVNLIDRLSITPNPTRGDVTLALPDTALQTMNISIYNALGAQVSFGIYDVTSGQVTLPMEQLSKGVYFIKVNGSETFKIVKQ